MCEEIAANASVNCQLPLLSIQERKEEGKMIEQKVKSLIASQLNIAEDKVVDSARLIEDLGADSLDIVEMLMTLEEEFGINIPDEETANMKTVAEIVKVIENKKN